MAALLEAKPLRGRLLEKRLLLAQKGLWRSMPRMYKDILSRCRVIFTVWSGTPRETVKEISGIDMSDPSVRLFNYRGHWTETDAKGNIVRENFDTYVLGIEDLGITTPDGHFHGMDDWKDFIVSIRRVEPDHKIYLTFQVTYTHVAVYLDKEEVFRSEFPTVTPYPLTVIAFPLP